MKEKTGMYQKTFSVNISSATKPLNPTDFPPRKALRLLRFQGTGILTSRFPMIRKAGTQQSSTASFCACRARRRGQRHDDGRPRLFKTRGEKVRPMCAL
ncbi:hypothetical protein G8D25_09810 [Ralstonia solanacearum]|uniref:hypothetical protein n=1 Tax=Ralstonia solanacearum TaxID=305 RepID=UPI00144910FC|nr:hypothetical protein [Ralstonia solanacearum]QJC24501.1 hypothetical protein G8D25_09810 [Ralstonia solanacearum]